MSLSNDSKVEVDAVLNNLLVLNSKDILKKLVILLPAFTTVGAHPVWNNDGNNTRVLVYSTLQQTAVAATQGTLALSTPYGVSNLSLSVTSSTSTGANSAVPRSQAMTNFISLGGYSDGLSLWPANTALSVNYSANPTGLTGVLTVYYFDL
jgi:hypothetical protein